MVASNIRNFCIISHIDHGKSTLADRFLELTETVPKEKMRPQFLDLMDLERERGITIKMQPVRMKFGKYILNLIDTPGHVDFSYEVSRSLAAVEGAILLVDGAKGIQAQTVSNLELARKQNLVIIPVVNKIDLANARVEEVTLELANLLGIDKNEVIQISAKYGLNVEELLESVIEKIPPPEGSPQNPLRALIFDSKYDLYLGVIAYLRIIDGELQIGSKIHLTAAKTEGQAKEIGYFTPERSIQKTLKIGEIGYLATGIKELGKVRVGDTVTKIPNLEPLPGYREPKPMVFASIYPENSDDFEILEEALAKLKLNDASLSFELESKESLGRGYRCGFLGSLHAEIISERLRREFGLNLVVSIPSVVFKIINQKDQEIFIYSPNDWPTASEIKEILEPWVKLEIITPPAFLGSVFEILENKGGKHIENRPISQDRILLVEEVPLREIIVGFYEKLKGQSQGFASANYEILGYRPGDLVKLEIFIGGEREEAFSRIVSRTRAFKEGKKIVEKLKEILPPQLFSVPLQAAVSGKIIARETIKAKRRDVIAPLYGGDYTRKRKLLEKQKKGKRKLKEKGRIRLSPRVFLEMFRS
jgi:GTP-binding protein LepA